MTSKKRDRFARDVLWRGKEEKGVELLRFKRVASSSFSLLSFAHLFFLAFRHRPAIHLDLFGSRTHTLDGGVQ